MTATKTPTEKTAEKAAEKVRDYSKNADYDVAYRANRAAEALQNHAEYLQKAAAQALKYAEKLCIGGHADSIRHLTADYIMTDITVDHSAKKVADSLHRLETALAVDLQLDRILAESGYDGQ
jgi:bisphosphoglycerate-dependent phosphoglycerate mutase